ncbi:MAG: phosphomannomutase/phosphoglucomutase [Acidobacteriota bacterium]|nr:phosphomannomutase/phosphoglucomutase [Acidobacteriota bacterium]
MNPNIFREYDIRGIVGEDLNAETVEVLAKAIGTFFRINNAKRIAVGFDSRESSPEFCEILTKTLNKTGCDIIQIGRVPTPVLYHTVYTQKIDGGVMITGSHNPSNHNGFKICLGKQTLFGSQIQEIKKITLSDDFAKGNGTNENIEVLENYEKDILSKINLGKRKLKVAVDAGNGMGGVTSVPVYKKLGVEVIELFTEPDSNFPNHEPDPSQEKNLKELISTVVEKKADLGVAFDGDADRITVIDETGRIIWGDELLILFVRDVLPNFPNRIVIAEVKCTQTLFDEIETLGGIPVMSKAGHSIIKAKIKETNAILAGEMSGHIFFNDRFYGFDDACYAGARLLEILSKTQKTLSELLSDVPKTFSTPEIRIPCREEIKFKVVAKIAEEFSKTNEVITIDGARIIFENGWGLVRASNTQAILVLRFEADSEESLKEIQEMVESKVNKLIV